MANCTGFQLNIFFRSSEENGASTAEALKQALFSACASGAPEVGVVDCDANAEHAVCTNFVAKASPDVKLPLVLANGVGHTPDPSKTGEDVTSDLAKRAVELPHMVARQLKQAGATLFGWNECGYTRRQLGLFGNSFESAQLEYVNCRGSDAEKARCAAAGVQSAPTWVFDRSSSAHAAAGAATDPGDRLKRALSAAGGAGSTSSGVIHAPGMRGLVELGTMAVQVQETWMDHARRD